MYQEDRIQALKFFWPVLSLFLKKVKSCYELQKFKFACEKNCLILVLDFSFIPIKTLIYCCVEYTELEKQIFKAEEIIKIGAK